MERNNQNTVLDLQGLTMVFGGLVAVNDFDLTLFQGDLVGLIGPNGAGKTTLFNMVTGQYAPTRGKIRFKDQEINLFKPHQITALGIARTFQNIRLFGNMSVIENILVSFHCRLQIGFASAMFNLPSYLDRERAMRFEAMELLEAVGLSDVSGEEAQALPYGKQRRLEIARALATHPQLLFLDEPAAGMNPQETINLMRFIQHIREQFNLTILLIEHDMKVVMGICQRVSVMDFGIKIAEGTPEEIRHDPRVIEAYLGVEK